MKFDQYLCDMNSTLGSVVPLAMFYITRPVETFDSDVQDTKKPALELLKVAWSKMILK